MAVHGNKVNAVQTSTGFKFGTSKELLKANETRNGSQIVCNHATIGMYLGLGKAAVAKEGIYLVAKGGAWDGMVGPMVWTGSVFGIAESEETEATVVEV